MNIVEKLHDDTIFKISKPHKSRQTLPKIVKHSVRLLIGSAPQIFFFIFGLSSLDSLRIDEMFVIIKFILILYCVWNMY